MVLEGEKKCNKSWQRNRPCDICLSQHMECTHQSVGARLDNSTNINEIKETLQNISQPVMQMEGPYNRYRLWPIFTKFTCSLSDLRNRRPRRLPSGIRTNSVTAFSSSDFGSLGREASISAKCLSSSCKLENHGVSI